MIKCLLFGHKYKIIDKFSTNVDYARYIFWCPACGSLKQKMEPVFQDPLREKKG